MTLRGFYFITDSGLSRDGNLADVCAALRAGVRVVQYREKRRPLAACCAEILLIRGFCRAFGALLLVNDSLEIAQRVDADGVHLGQKDTPLSTARHILPRKILGISVETVSQAQEAQAQGASYIGVGAVFPTQTKQKTSPPLGIAQLRKIKAAVRIPVVAIGGITPENAPQVLSAHADMISAISASLQGSTVYQNILAFQSQFPR